MRRWAYLKTLAGAAVALVVCLRPTIAAAQDRWRATLAVTSNYVYRGLSQTQGGAAVQAGVHYNSPHGVIVGAWASTVEFTPYEDATFELNAYLGKRFTLDAGWQATVLAVHYEYPGNRYPERYRYDELTIAFAQDDWLVLNLAWSPNTVSRFDIPDAPTRRAVGADVAVQAPLWGRISAYGGVGYYDIHHVAGYEYWSAGLRYRAGPMLFDLARYGASEAADMRYWNANSARWSATLSWRF